MSRIKQAFDKSGDPLLNIYFTAGFPSLDSTVSVLMSLEEAGVDMVEIGMPYSDPLADGPTIQQSSKQALTNGMSIEVLFNQLEHMRRDIALPIILMGYLNPIMQFGIVRFCKKCAEIGVDGLIIPDLPMELFDAEFSYLLSEHGLDYIFLITPETREPRIREIDRKGTGFIYMVSSSSTTGSTGELSNDQLDYFKRMENMKLANKRMIGFGISDNQSFQQATDQSDGAIVGSAFIKQLEKDGSSQAIKKFVDRLLNRVD